MALNQHNIHDVVNKFWEGQSTLEEERELRDYFRYHSVPDGLEGIASYLELSGQEQTGLDSDFDEKMMDAISSKPKGAIVYLRPLLRVAAVVALIVAAAILFRNDEAPIAETNLPQQDVLADPEVRAAFEQTRSALMMVGSKMNQGHSQTLKLNKFHETNLALTANEITEEK